MSLDMTNSWLKHGIRATGLNYWTIWSIHNGVSSRYLREHKQYQSWIGAYLVHFEDDREFSLQDHFNLAVADQINWLEDLGDPQPFIEMPAKNARERESIFVDGYKVQIYETMENFSHSDVWPESRRVFARILLSIAANMFNISNLALELKSEQLLPKPKDDTVNYEMVNLKGYIGVVYLEKNTYLVLYGNAAEITHPDGTKTDYYPMLRDDIMRAFSATSIEKIR